MSVGKRVLVRQKVDAEDGVVQSQDLIKRSSDVINITLLPTLYPVQSGKLYPLCSACSSKPNTIS